MRSSDDTPPSLFARWPRLAERLPRHPIVEGVSPVQRMSELETGLATPASLWIKRDDRVGRLYGGNKPRKLEFLLGRAQQQGARAVVTVGGLGSNHCLATAIYGREAGLRVRVCLVDQPLTDKVRETLGRMAAHGARIHHSRTKVRTAFCLLKGLAAETVRAPAHRPMLIMPGGSVPLGTVGIVNAALEVVDQVEVGALPRPGAVVVALGSAGTHAGLLAGFRLAGWSVPVVGVKVNHTLKLDPGVISGLANRTLKLLRRRDSGVPEVMVDPAEVRIEEEELGPGYGHPTEAGQRAVRLLAETEGITLDETYTGKAMAAFLRYARQAADGRPLLFWHTYNTRPLSPPDPGWQGRLPGSLRAMVGAEAS